MGKIVERNERRAAERELYRSFQKTAPKPHILDPVRMYNFEARWVLYYMAKHIARRGWAPLFEELLEYAKWRRDALLKYIKDLEACGLIFRNPQFGWMPTELGFEALHVEPVEPVLPSSYAERRRIQLAVRTARKHAKRLDTFDPKILEYV